MWNPFRKNEAEILQDSLQALADGEDLAEFLARHPDQEDGLRRSLQAADWLARRTALLEPEGDFLERTRARLLRDLRHRTTPRRRTGRRFTVRIRRASRRLQPVLLVVLLLVLLNIPFQLYQSARIALPGEALYPVKQFQESAQLAVTFDPFAQAALQVHYSRQRILELHELMLDGRYEEVNLAVNLFQAQIERTDMALQRAAGRDPDRAAALARQLRQTIWDQRMVTLYLIGTMPHGLRTGLEQALLLSSH